MPKTHFTPKSPGRFGTQVALVSRHAGTNPLTANTTVNIRMGSVPSRSWVEGCAVSCSTSAADADGTILATLTKYDASANAAVALSSALSLEGLTANEGTSFTMLTTLTPAQRILDTGDTLYVAVVNNSAAIDTQPADLVFTAELLVQE